MTESTSDTQTGTFGLRGLVVDWGGVLTAGFDDATEQWAIADGFDVAHFHALMRQWFGPEAEQESRVNPIHALERGEMSLPDFDERLATELSRLQGAPVSSEGLLQRMFARFEHAPDMAGLVHRARKAGLRTALLSNSWGNEYPRDGWDDMFDAVVISGEVGMRKPDPEIYEHTVALIDLKPDECVFVDDLTHNVRAAAALGFVGVQHTSYAQTSAELEALFGIPLA